MPRTIGLSKHLQRGLTMIELLIALTVALFLLGGLLKIVQSTRRTFGDQNELAQLQDNQRLAMTFMTDVIESGGYYPNPKLNTAVAVLPVVGTTFAAGQAIYGTTSAGGDTVTSRYGAGQNDNVFNCLGQKNTAVANYDTFVNTFSVDTVNKQLICTFSSSVTPNTAVVLVNGVRSLAILYGVKHNVANTGSCTDTYLNAGQMQPADWSAVCSVRVTLTFDNPLIPAQPVSITRVIGVMNTAGVNT